MSLSWFGGVSGSGGFGEDLVEEGGADVGVAVGFGPGLGVEAVLAAGGDGEVALEVFGDGGAAGVAGAHDPGHGGAGLEVVLQGAVAGGGGALAEALVVGAAHGDDHAAFGCPVGASGQEVEVLDAGLSGPHVEVEVVAAPGELGQDVLLELALEVAQLGVDALGALGLGGAQPPAEEEAQAVTDGLLALGAQGGGLGRVGYGGPLLSRARSLPSSDSSARPRGVR